MIDKLAQWIDARLAFLGGLGLGIWETIYGEARLTVYGFCLMLISPAFSNVADRILTGRRNGNGNGKGD